MKHGACPAHLILGGVRSGKSAYAEGLALELGIPTVYLATGQAGDDEMQERISRHRQRRPDHWETLEEGLDPGGALDLYLQSASGPTAVIVDSIDFWVANLLMAHEDREYGEVESLALQSASRLMDAGRKSRATMFLVSAEVGLAPVPPEPLGRRFQDLLGHVNQQLAKSATRVSLVVAGAPLTIKDTTVAACG